MKRNIYVIIFALFILVLCSSCVDSVSNDKSSFEIEQTPIIEEVEEADGIRVVSITNAEYYLYKMEPLWSYSVDNTPYGSTIKSGVPFIPGTNTQLTGFDGYKCVEANKNTLGLFSQGKWKLTLYALDKNGNQIIKDPIVKEVYLNSFSNSLKIDMDNQLFLSGTNCSVKLSNFRFELVENENKYGVEEKGGYKLTVSLSKVNDGLAHSFTKITDFDILVQDNNKTNIKFLSKSGNENDSKVYGLIEDLTIAEKLQNGSYVISIKLQEYTEEGFVDAGGMTFSFYARNGFVSEIEGNGSIIDLKAADYVTPGTGGGIEIDSGTNSTVVVNAFKVGNDGETKLAATETVNTSDTVKFKPVVTNGPATITSYKWFIDGVEPAGTSIDSNGCLTYKPTTAKTYTITYMFLDGTSYNTISGNYYLTVTAS